MLFRSIVGNTPVCPVAAMECAEKNLYAVQFHPEVMHTVEGTKMLSNFVYNICKCSGDWKMSSFVEDSINKLKEKFKQTNFVKSKYFTDQSLYV